MGFAPGIAGATNHYRTRNINVPCNILHGSGIYYFLISRHGHVKHHVIITSHIWPFAYILKYQYIDVQFIIWSSWSYFLQHIVGW